MQEFLNPTAYKTLNALFTRKLNTPREIDADRQNFISPCDSLVTQSGTLHKNTLMQIKGMYYKVDDLLAGIPAQEVEKCYDGEYINFYLSPKDYHRYHMPLDCKVKRVVHVPGKLYPVNIPTLKKKLNLFVENERVIVECESLQGNTFFLVLVGALNVGKMEVSFEPRIQTNTKTGSFSVYEYDEPLNLKKGDDFGCFKMGSTVVAITQKEMLELNVLNNAKVRFSQVIAREKSI